MQYNTKPFFAKSVQTIAKAIHEEKSDSRRKILLYFVMLLLISEYVTITNFVLQFLRGRVLGYWSGTVNSNTVNSKFHLIWSFFEIFSKFLPFHV